MPFFVSHRHCTIFLWQQGAGPMRLGFDERAVSFPQRPPEVCGVSTRIVQDDLGRIELLHQANTPLQTKSRTTRTLRDPGQGDIGDDVVVGIK